MQPQDLLTSQTEVAAALGMSPATFERYLTRYPWHGAEVSSGKINGRWRVFRTDVLAWWAWVCRQELRHPEARRYRPEEPPTVASIQGRGGRAAGEKPVDETPCQPLQGHHKAIISPS